MKEIIVYINVVILQLLAVSIQCFENQNQQDTSTACGGCLILTPYIRNGKASIARTLSQVDPDRFLGFKSHAGFMTVNEQYDSNLFFWFFPAKTQLGRTPWIIWLQGGPGFSSMLGLFDIIGPMKVENGEVKLRNISWTSDYSVLFLDNPVGAGFSFSKNGDGCPDNEDDVGVQMLEFLQQFLEMFPELREAPLFLAGESYAGKYVPALGIQIHKNMQYKTINLRGLIIGNGLIDPHSLMHYSQLLSALGLLEDDKLDSVKTLEETVVLLIDEGQMVNASNKFNETIEYIKKHTGVSIYNFNKDPEPNTKAPEFEKFLNRPDIRALLGTGNVTFNYNNQDVYNKMLPDIMNSTKLMLEELLEHYGVLCYHGQQDIILAYSLAINTYKALKWSRRQEYIDAPRKSVRNLEKGDIVAFKKSGGNFAEVLIRRAGHMVPVDQPEVAKYIIDHFINKYKN